MSSQESTLRARARADIDLTDDPARPSQSPLEPVRALGISALGWLVGAGILEAFSRAPAAGKLVEAASGGFHLAQLLVPLLAGFLWQSSASMLPSGARLRRAAGLWAAWTALMLAMALTLPLIGLSAPWSALDLVAQQAGLLLGITLGWLCTPGLAPKLASWLKTGETIAQGLMIVLGVTIVLIPLVPDTSIFSPASGWRVDSPRGYLKAIPGQIYLVLKSLILWVPLGLVYALAQKQGQIRAWTRAAILAFVLTGLPLLREALRVQDLVEILSAYWGIGLGVLLGSEVYSTLAESTIAPAVASVPTAPSGPSAQSAPVVSSVPTSAPIAIRPPKAAMARWLRRIAALLLLVAVGMWAWLFPRWGPLLSLGLACYALLLLRFRHAWLVVVPAALPLLNLAPGTGRFYFDEFDMVMATTVAMALWHGAGPAPRLAFSRPIVVTLALFGVSMAVSLVIGLLPLSALDANAFTNYLSHYNSLRVAKGFAWALPILAMMRWTLPAETRLVVRLFAIGMWLGLAGVIAAGLWERELFASLTDLTILYRVTATFSSMHTGGSEIETYLVTAIPFVWLAFGKEWPPAVRFAGLVLLALSAYVMTLTIARAGMLALGVVLVILVVSAWRVALPDAKRAWPVTTVVVGFLAGAVVLAVGLSGGYMQRRLASTEEDWGVRVKHWQTALSMRDRDFLTTSFGMGLGRFPEAYFFRSGAASLPGSYGFTDEDGNRFLRLGGGETLYLAQRVAAKDGQHYALTLHVRTNNANARLGVPLCEKQLLNSFRCQWQVIPVPADGNWHTESIALDTGLVGAGNWLTRRPVELSLYNETESTVIDVDDVELRGETGEQLIRNGNFSAGGDYWFFKTHSHLPWHIKNLWVEVLFEQGWFGLIGFTLMLAAVLVHLARAVWRGDRLAGVLLASTGGFLTVALFGSLFDAPRIATLFFLLVALAVIALPVRDLSRR